MSSLTMLIQVPSDDYEYSDQVQQAIIHNSFM